MELEWDLSQVNPKLGVNYIEDMRTLMLEYGLTDEESITFFLFTISIECQNGKYMLEERPMSQYSGLSYTPNTRGAGLIQLTGPDQKEFLEYLLANTENENERAILERYINNFIDIDPDPSDEKHIWDNPPENLNPNDLGVELPSVAEYIAENYPIESALWYWCVYKKAKVGGKFLSLNECIQTDWNEVYKDDTYAGDDSDYRLMMFTGTQCAVNGSEFWPIGIGRFFMSWNYIEFSGDKYYDPDGGEHKEGSIILHCRDDNNDPDSFKTAESYKPNGWDVGENPRLEFYNNHIEYFENLQIR